MKTDILDGETRLRLIMLYLIWAVLILGIGTEALGHVVIQIGEKFGGFIWMFDSAREPPFFVSFDLWRSLPPRPDRIGLLDEIVSINGRSPWEFGQVYEQTMTGDMVTYVVRRGSQRLVIRERVEIFSLDKFIISHGMLYLAAWIYLLSGLFLLRTTKRKEFALFAFIFLFASGAWLIHGSVWGVHAPYYGKTLYNLILFEPAAPMVGAILLHISTLYPTRRSRLLAHRFFPQIFYLIAFLLIVIYTLTRKPDLNSVNLLSVGGMFMYGMIGLVALTSHCLMVYGVARWRGQESQQQALEPMLLPLLAAVLVFIVVGMAPMMVFKYMLLPFEIWITFVMAIPLLLIYAMRNVELIESLHREVHLRQQYSEQVGELRNIRERTLHEVADALHDQVVPELRGLHFAAVALRRRMRGEGTPALSKELEFISDTLDAVSKDVRAIMEGAKPVDWTQTSLSQAIQWLGNGLSQRNRHVQVKVDVSCYDNADGPLVKEALYWIARAALNNVQDHARATEVQLSLKSDDDQVVLEIVDDGVGFDVEAYMASPVSDRRHLGLANMRSRAAEIGGKITFTSSPGAGLRITVVVPRKEL